MWSTLLDKGHPVWSLIRLTILMLSLTAILYSNASNFDVTELKTIISVFMVAAGAEGISQLFKGKKE